MDEINEYSSMLSNRELLYLFLGRIYRVEADQFLLDRMRLMTFPAACRDKALEEGYRMMADYIGALEADALTELAADYARVFLGAGLALPNAAYPYESVYTSQSKIFMQEARDQVAALYRAKGLCIEKMPGTPEDHLAFELEYMACLCCDARQAYLSGNQAELRESFAAQMVFLREHLLNWLPSFCADVGKYSETAFYRSAAKITVGFLRLDGENLEALIRNC